MFISQIQTAKLNCPARMEIKKGNIHDRYSLFYKLFMGLYIEPEVHDIAIRHNISFSFNS